ncbi:hypothetical protein FRB91_004052 [Serendipita sp. 411]|nr:hypothetical protein FRC19_009340 [Serendipita sp. 401]KAG8860264.1 hypothetical protein FRB91_004052 [Serendipita sp. 411]KAG9057151.1 hypothetical protein FS842_008443 [Serendipita sp. 407]
MPRQRTTRPRQEGADEEMQGPEGGNPAAPPPSEPIQVGEELPPFDPKTFQSHPISASNHAKVKTITENWDGPGVPLDHLAQMIRESAVLLMEVGSTYADPMLLRDLEKTMKEVIDQQASLNARKTAAMDIRHDLTNGVKIVDPAANWLKRFEEKVEAYEKQTTRQKYAKNSLYQEYREEVWGADPENEGGMPPLNSMIPKEDGDETDSDDEVEVGGMAKSYKDPLTRAWLEEPMKSQSCGHVYSKVSIYEYLGRNTVSCPTPGCDKMISKKDLQPDENMARQVRNAKRREEESYGRSNRGKKNKDRIVIDDDDEIVD